MNRILKTIALLSFSSLTFVSCASGVELLKPNANKPVVKNGIETTLKGIKATEMNANFVFIDISLKFKNQTSQYIRLQLCESETPLDSSNLEYNLKRNGFLDLYKKSPEKFDTKFWTKNSDTKIHSSPTINKPYYYTLYVNPKDGKRNNSYNPETNVQFIKPSDYKGTFTLSGKCSGVPNGSFFETSTEWIAPNASIEVDLRHSLIRGTKPVLLQHPDYFEFELDIEPIR
ncbi:hypothetical protein [Leptospira brenneri]|uniref:Lipoprotein n=1 Tax=Leptospira brenneri TaxID=2023182 RepID=A0A5F1ZAZ4_9LEPT|nr:hypothetical protein [Leptospira brenneri]TGK96550.1 hypothetical protein EHQ30_08110 [Leptospira brenneri]